MTFSIYAPDEVFDSRDLIERIEEIQDIGELLEDEREELNLLLDLDNTVWTVPDWKSGATMISDGCFEDYAREFAEDCGMVNQENSMSNYIDWSAFARDLQMKYTDIEVNGRTYWVR